jgi:hypothetical protein
MSTVTHAALARLKASMKKQLEIVVRRPSRRLNEINFAFGRFPTRGRTNSVGVALAARNRNFHLLADARGQLRAS